jgi:hypothetical protein
MDDLISRQAAIDAIGGNEPVGDPSKMDDDDVIKMWERIRIINIINKLPSAQPNVHDFPKDADCISRADALEALGEEPPVWTGSDYELGQRNQYDLDRLHLELVPSAQPKTGKWTVKNGELAFWDVCSVCGKMVMHKAPFYNYCPNCGAKMLKEGE